MGLRHNTSPTPSRGPLELLLHWGRGRFDGPRDAHPFEEISRPAASNSQQHAACWPGLHLRCVVGVEAQRRRAMPIGLFPAPRSLWPQVSLRGALRSTYSVLCRRLLSGCVARHQGLAPEPIMAQETILSGQPPARSWLRIRLWSRSLFFSAFVWCYCLTDAR